MVINLKSFNGWITNLQKTYNQNIAYVITTGNPVLKGNKKSRENAESPKQIIEIDQVILLMQATVISYMTKCLILLCYNQTFSLKACIFAFFMTMILFSIFQNHSFSLHFTVVNLVVLHYASLPNKSIET